MGNEAGQLPDIWRDLARHLAAERSDFLVLPEMPFSPWLAATREVDNSRWRTAVTVHRRWCDRLEELGVAAALGSRPVDDPEPRNRAFLWCQGAGLTNLHDKVYLPDEDGFWEATWYRRGRPEYALAEVVDAQRGRAHVGTLLCTEMWFLEHARAYGRAGAHVLAVPRATPAATLDKWIAGGRTAAVVSGAYCLSSAPYTGSDDGDLGGGGWIIDPDGQVMATTSTARPFVTCEIDLQHAEAAKAGYPRYVAEAVE
jgi:N-carbamoylputrescine amidase